TIPLCLGHLRLELPPSSSPRKGSRRLQTRPTLSLRASRPL
ncbi:INPPL1 isoform 1, partial [Pongo abelii]